MPGDTRRLQLSVVTSNSPAGARKQNTQLHPEVTTLSCDFKFTGKGKERTPGYIRKLKLSVVTSNFPAGAKKKSARLHPEVAVFFSGARPGICSSRFYLALRGEASMCVFGTPPPRFRSHPSPAFFSGAHQGTCNPRFNLALRGEASICAF